MGVATPYQSTRIHGGLNLVFANQLFCNLIGLQNSTAMTSSHVMIIYSLSLAFLPEVTGCGVSEGGFAGFPRAITVTERAIARSVDCECPTSGKDVTIMALKSKHGGHT